MSFIKTAGKKTGDIRAFIREASSGNSIKYKIEKGKKHIIYIPYQDVEIVDEDTNEVRAQRQVIALTGKVHDWTTPDGYFHSTVCLEGVISKDDNGDIVNDGTCPICEAVSKAWEIYKYRIEREEKTCTLTGKQLQDHLDKKKREFAEERKAKDANSFMYLLIVKYRTDDNGKPILDEKGIPEFDLKVMKLSDKRLDKMLKQMENAGCEFPGSEIAFDYPNLDDIRAVSAQSTTSPIWEQKQLVKQYPGLKEAIDKQVAKFQWEGIEKSFPEWSGMTTQQAQIMIDKLFSSWNKYQVELATNPNAEYLEYVGADSTTKPELEQGTKVELPGKLPDANQIFSGMSDGPMGVQLPGQGDSDTSGDLSNLDI